MILELIDIRFELAGGTHTTAQVRCEEIEAFVEKVAQGHGVIRFSSADGQRALLAAAHIMAVYYQLPEDEGEEIMRKYGTSDDQRLTPQPETEQGITTAAAAQPWAPQAWTPQDAKELREENEGDEVQGPASAQ